MKKLTIVSVLVIVVFGFASAKVWGILISPSIQNTFVHQKKIKFNRIGLKMKLEESKQKKREGHYFLVPFRIIKAPSAISIAGQKICPS